MEEKAFRCSAKSSLFANNLQTYANIVLFARRVFQVKNIYESRKKKKERKLFSSGIVKFFVNGSRLTNIILIPICKF